jgi:hypothetical protein
MRQAVRVSITDASAALPNRDYGLAVAGAPVHPATIGAGDLARSAGLYRNQMGLDILEQRQMSGRAFEMHWGLPAGSTANVAVLGESRFPVGQLVLIEFDAPAP